MQHFVIIIFLSFQLANKLKIMSVEQRKGFLWIFLKDELKNNKGQRKMRRNDACY